MGKWSMRDFAYHGPMPWEDEAECGPVVMGLDLSPRDYNVAVGSFAPHETIMDFIADADRRMREATGLTPEMLQHPPCRMLSQEAKNARARAVADGLSRFQWPKQLVTDAFGNEIPPGVIRRMKPIREGQHYSLRSTRQPSSSITWVRTHNQSTCVTRWVMAAQLADGIRITVDLNVALQVRRREAADLLRKMKYRLWTAVQRVRVPRTPRQEVMALRVAKQKERGHPY